MSWKNFFIFFFSSQLKLTFIIQVWPIPPLSFSSSSSLEIIKSIIKKKSLSLIIYFKSDYYYWPKKRERNRIAPKKIKTYNHNHSNDSGREESPFFMWPLWPCSILVFYVWIYSIEKKEEKRCFFFSKVKNNDKLYYYS